MSAHEIREANTHLIPLLLGPLYKNVTLMRYQKRYFTLLEVSIALCLVAVLVTLMLRFYTEAHLLDSKLDAAKEIVWQRSNTGARLSQVFKEIPEASIATPKVPAFYTKKYPKEDFQSLTFIFDNGIDPSPDFSGPVLGRLALIDQNLCLLIWPIEKDDKRSYRRELLMEGVSSIQYEFFVSDKDSFKWQDQWKSERKDLPSMIKLHIKEKENLLSFAFFLPMKDPEILYKAEK